MVRTCPGCNQEKGAGQFYQNRRGANLLSTRCKLCSRRRNAENYRRRQLGLGPRVAIPPEGFRRCPDCREVKSLDDFPRNRASVTGYGSYCKPCHNAKGKATYTRLYGSTRHYHLQRRYGISAERVEELIREQGGVCAICLTGKPEHVDHDHRTGRVRGILCFNCNGGLGQMRDRVDVLLAAVDYLGEKPWRKSLVAPGVYRLSS